MHVCQAKHQDGWMNDIDLPVPRVGLSLQETGLLPVCRLGGAVPLRCCSAAGAASHSLQGDMPLWETTLGRCVASQWPVLDMSFQDWQPISLVGRRLVPSTLTHGHPQDRLVASAQRGLSLGPPHM